MPPATTITRRPSLLVITLALLLSACAALPPEEAESPAGLAAQAREALESGKFAIAAREYLQLAAGAAENARNLFLLNAADAYLRGNFTEQAQRTLESIDPAGLAPDQYTRRQLLLASIALDQQNPRLALHHLRDALHLASPPHMSAQVHEMRARAYALAGNALEAARERITVDTFLSEDEARARNQRELWAALMDLSETALASLRTAPPPDVLSGWLELAQLTKTQQILEPLPQRLADWRTRYPEHPAVLEWLGLMALPAPALVAGPQPHRIALLLPISGAFAGAAMAVRDGFLAAHFQRDDRDYLPDIRIYDTHGDAAAIIALYQRAVAEGAEFVVGPLEKDAVAALRASDVITVPTLALNYAEGVSPAPSAFYQFGLAPEDEARQVAERAWLEGYNTALALTPSGDWGQRVLIAFRDHYAQLGGVVLEEQVYVANHSDYSGPISKLLNIDESDARANTLRNTLQSDVKSEPRRREDADFIFLAAFPRQARLIRPQLKFFYAGDLPLFATSHVYDGTPNPAKDRDMDGIFFTDMPWVLDDTAAQGRLKEAVHQVWPNAAEQSQRLHALGADAYTLVNRINLLRGGELPGNTGRLSVDHNNRLHRSLMWAQFGGGLPQPVSETVNLAR